MNTKKYVVIFQHWRSNFWLNVALDLCSEAVKSGFVPLVVDMSAFHSPPQSPWRTDLAILPKSQEKFLDTVFSTVGGKFIRIPRSSKKKDIFVTMQVRESLRVAANSTLNYVSRNSFLNGKGFISKFHEFRYLRRATKVYGDLSSFIDGLNVEIVQAYVVNGRMDSQRATAMVLGERGIPVNYLEHSEFPGSLYNRPYRPHDRERFQEEAFESTKSLSSDEIQINVEEWRALRTRPNSPTNPFSSLWKPGALNFNAQNKSPIVTFFTSSSDEFESLDLDWKEADWSNQYEAFSEIWKHLKTSNPEFQPVLRVHPNLGNKAISDVIQERKLVNKFLRQNREFVCFDHASPANTYELVEVSSLVVVYNSTVGLEANLIGKHVLCANSTWYDKISDILRVHRIEALGEIEGYLRRIPNSAGAKRWVAAQRVLDRKVQISRELNFNSNLAKMISQAIRAVIDLSVISILLAQKWKLIRAINLKLRVVTTKPWREEQDQ